MPAPRDDTERVSREQTVRDRRARARHDRRAQSAVVAVAVVVGLVAAALGTRPEQEARALSHPTVTTVKPVATKAKTVLFAHVDGKHRLDLLVVAGIHTGGRVASVVFVPTTTLVQVPAFDTQTLTDLPKLGSSTLLATTVSNALGIHFNQVTVVGDKGLTELLAPAKRFDVTFVRPVQVDDSAGTLAFTSGRAHISASDATRLLTGNDSAGILEHLVTVQAVLQGWFDRMRNESVARTTIKVSSQARNLVALARADVGFDTLPVDTLSSGSIARYEIRQPDADQLVRADLPSAMFTTGPRLRVEVLNGTGAIALTQEVARRVVPAGDEVTLTGNVPGFGVRHTQVVYYRTADLPAARRLAAALGVGSVALGNVPLDVVDLTVVVGKDFHPTRR
jgi:hypothetical protein